MYFTTKISPDIHSGILVLCLTTHRTSKKFSKFPIFWKWEVMNGFPTGDKIENDSMNKQGSCQDLRM